MYNADFVNGAYEKILCIISGWCQSTFPFISEIEKKCILLNILFLNVVVNLH